jgi:hypothetical protein
MMNLRRMSYGTAILIAAAAIAAFVLSARQVGGDGSGGDRDDGDEHRTSTSSGGTADTTELTDAPSKPHVSEGKPIDPATAGLIRGTVTFAGTPPAPKELALISGCQSDGPVFDQPVAVADGKLASVFVWVKSGLDGWQLPAPPADPVEIDQKGCIYSPRVSGAQVGQKLHILNSDPILHNVHIDATVNRSSNSGMPPKAKPLIKTLKKQEVMVHLKCDVHAWMTAYVGVVPHPFFAVTSASGEFAIGGLPPGTYTLEAWHEQLGTKTLEVTVPQPSPAAIAY